EVAAAAVPSLTTRRPPLEKVAARRLLSTVTAGHRISVIEKFQTAPGPVLRRGRRAHDGQRGTGVGEAGRGRGHAGPVQEVDMEDDHVRARADLERGLVATDVLVVSVISSADPRE